MNSYHVYPQPTPAPQGSWRHSNAARNIAVTMLVVASLVALGAVSYLMSDGWKTTGSQSATVAAIPTVIPFNQLTGAEWLTLSRSAQDGYTRQALIGFRCPSSMNANDLALAVSRAANTPAGRDEKAMRLFAAQLALAGCTA